jgi:hypothetical protein
MATFSYATEFAAFGDSLTGKVYPNGEYEMRVKTAKAGQTKGGKECFRITLAFTSGPNKGKEIFEQMTWSPENETAVKIFVQGLTNLGISPSWVKETKPTPEQIAARIEGAVVLVKLSEDEYQGEKRNRVKFSKFISRPAGSNGSASAQPAAELTADDLTDEDVASLDGPADPEDPWS